MAKATPTGSTRRALALALLVATGFAGLGYQIVWTEQSALWLGHESAAVLAVVAAFFAGLALGALALGPVVERSAQPVRWYAACETVVGLWTLALAVLLTPATTWLVGLIGAEPSPARHWAVAFGGTFVLLLPATAAMGATLPAMERVLARARSSGSSIAVLYAGNTFGAVLGVLAAAFVLVPALGLARTAFACALLNFAAAGIALRAFGAAHWPAPPAAESRSVRGSPLLAATGFLGIGYEVLVVRLLSQVTENTVYTFALLLAVYLVGTALGAAAYARVLAGEALREALHDRLLRALAASCLVGALALAGAEPLRHAVLAVLGSSVAAALAAETLLALAAFLLPTVAMGALFSHLATTSSGGFARALGSNTLGAAAAPLVFGVVLIPWLGSKVALLAVAAGYLALVSRRAWTAPSQWVAAAAVGAFALVAPPLALVAVPTGARLVSLNEGVMATVAIVEDAAGVASLHVNNRQQEGSSATVLADSRQALLPLLLHPAPRRALFLGLGTGVTASAAADEPALRVDAVELLPEVVAAAEHFAQRMRGEPLAARLHVVAADARRFVRASPERYDVVVADNFHPARSGSGALYTAEHFAAVRARLADDGGIFVQWLPLHQLDLDTLRSIVRSFLAVYPHGSALLATNSLDTPVVGLVARADSGVFDVAAVRARLAHFRSRVAPAELGLENELALLGNFIAGPRALAAFASAAPLNTDDRPIVAYRAPRLAYDAESLPRDRLIALLDELSLYPEEILAASADVGWSRRLAAYWSARDRFIEVGRDVEPTLDAERMLAQVREPLLGVLHESPDFRPAYEPLFRMAVAVADVDAAAARSLLLELQEVRARPDVTQALRDLAAKAP